MVHCCSFEIISVSHIIALRKMAESDRSRSPVPARNRGEQRGQEQGVRPELPFFPRWVTPMQAAVWHSTQMSRPQSRPQFSPQFTGVRPGPYMMNQAMGSLPQPPQRFQSNPCFPPAPPASPPPTIPYPVPPRMASPPCSPTMKCPSTQATSPSTPTITSSQPR